MKNKCHGSHPELSSTRNFFHESSSDVTASQNDNPICEEGFLLCVTCFLSKSWINVIKVIL